MQGSSARAAGDIDVQATAGDITLVASQLTGSNVHLNAAGDIQAADAVSTRQTTTDEHSQSSGIGITVSLSGAPVIPWANASIGTSNTRENTASRTPSAITAAGEASLSSGKDTTLTGSTVTGDKVTIKTGGDLSIESRQSGSHYDEHSQNTDISLQIDSVSGSAGSSQLHSDWQSVTRQAGIFAGDKGWDITVKDNTSLKGAILDSKTADNQLTTGTLRWTDIGNQAGYSGSSIGVQLDTGKTIGHGGNTETKNAGITPDIGMPVQGADSSTTKSAIAPGKITITDPAQQTQDISQLNRDTTNALNQLGQIFDKASLQEKQELAGLFGELAYNQVHRIAETMKKEAGTKEERDKWEDGGADKILLHAFVGGVMSDMTGAGAATCALGAGFNEAIQKELKKISDPVLHQWASVLAGAAATTVIGGNAVACASAAAKGTKENLLAWAKWVYLDTL